MTKIKWSNCKLITPYLISQKRFQATILNLSLRSILTVQYPQFDSSEYGN